MNHIQRLQAEVAHLQAREKLLLDGIQSIRDYVRSDKFATDDHVNVNDIVLRVDEVTGEWTDVFFEPWGAACLVSYEAETRSPRGWQQVVSEGDGRWGGERGRR